MTQDPLDAHILSEVVKKMRVGTRPKSDTDLYQRYAQCFNNISPAMIGYAFNDALKEGRVTRA